MAPSVYTLRLKPDITNTKTNRQETLNRQIKLINNEDENLTEIFFCGDELRQNVFMESSQ